MWSELFGTFVLVAFVVYQLWQIKDDLWMIIDNWEPPKDDE